MKTLFESFTNCELSESQLSLVSGGKCPCPGEDPEDPGDTTPPDDSSNTTSDGTVVYYYYYYY